MVIYIIEIIAISFSFLVILCYFFQNKNVQPIDWPLVGMLPIIFVNFQDINGYLVENMEKFQMTFLFKGSWFSNMRLLVTVDPANVQHIMCKKFNNYPKGSKFREIFDIFGDSIINSDGELWQYHRKLATTFLCHPKFNKLMVKKLWEKVEIGVVPILDHVSKNGLEIDLQDLFGRFTHDIICTLVVGHDPKSLSLDFPNLPFAKALDEVEQVFFYRHVPTFIWKFQRWLGVGKEKTYKNARKIIDNCMYEYVNSNKSSKENVKGNLDDEGLDLLSLYMHGSDSEESHTKWDDQFLRDIASNIILAGQDTTSTSLSWFFYLLSKNPQVITKIKEEIASLTTNIDQKETNNYLSHDFFEQHVDKLIYLHCALCEALRLYPPVAFEARCSVESDILPSGHHVDSNTPVAINLFAMARMKSIWGEDCNEFKPERWILENGMIRHEPSYKFFTFNAGPRACLGKNMAFFQMKVIAISIIQKYHFQKLDESQIIPDFSIILRMKNGFKVKLHTIV